jgi:hypothetical protein
MARSAHLDHPVTAAAAVVAALIESAPIFPIPLRPVFRFASARPAAQSLLALVTMAPPAQTILAHSMVSMRVALVLVLLVQRQKKPAARLRVEVRPGLLAVLVALLARISVAQVAVALLDQLVLARLAVRVTQGPRRPVRAVAVLTVAVAPLAQMLKSQPALEAVMEVMVLVVLAVVPVQIIVQTPVMVA